MVKYIAIAVPIFFLGLIGFMPKESLYYKVEEQLKQQGIVINEGKMSESFFNFTIENAEVYAKGINVATIDKISLFTVLLYSHIGIENFKTSKNLESMAPKSIDVADLTHKIFSPKSLSIDAFGSFGAAKGKVDGSARTVRIDFSETTGDLQKITKFLTKDGDGWYYESNF